MKQFPASALVPRSCVRLDPATQVGLWLGDDGTPIHPDAKHKKSETSKETTTRTSLDGRSDQGSDQEGDTD